MSPSKIFTAAALLLAASPAMAKTDIGGCVSSDTVINDRGGPYLSRVWYVPGTGEVCEILDCGGGRAPPKTNVPGCPGYEGTETYSPSYIKLGSTAAPEPTATSEAEAEITTTTTTAAEGSKKKASYEATLTEASLTEAPKQTTLSTAVSESESAAQSSNGTVTSAPVYSTPASGSSGSGSGSASDSTATPAASTAGAASMTAGGALVALMAGAAVFAML